MINDCTANDQDMFRVFYFTGDWRKSDKGGCWEIKVQEVGELGTGSGKF